MFYLLQDIRPLQEDTCGYYTSGSGYAYDSYSVEVIKTLVTYLS